VYSTCTTNPEENEAQIRFAVEELGLLILPLRPFAGFFFDDPAPDAKGSLLIRGHASGAQGFFIALLTKPIHGETQRPPSPSTPACASLPQFWSPYAPENDMRALLPPGETALYGEKIYFLPQAGLERLPAELRWQGCTLGKAQGGQARLFPYLRRLLPPVPGTGSLNLDSIAPLIDLLAGRGLKISLPGKHVFLYWRNLPLARLAVKGSRALLTSR